MKKILGIAVIVLITLIAFNISEKFTYSGTLTLDSNGDSYIMELNKVRKIEKDEKVSYSAVYSDGNNSVKVAFGIKKDNGGIYDIDNPVIDLDGKHYVMPRPLRKNDYTINGCTEHYISVTFWNVPFSDGFYLNGGFYFGSDDKKLF